ncbi:hypothetical protein BGZ76_004164 [Entomortierella beljakovae]|nr:hypothetical protein BGZ76_004164 [Entomortierella beljakovae]
MDAQIQPAGNENGTMQGNSERKTRGILKSLMHSESNLVALESSSQSTLMPKITLDEERTASNLTLFSKTWNIHKTTPFYNFRIDQLETYENELVSYIVANARSISSSILSQQNGTFVTGNRKFPSQIDGAGQNVIETVDDIGDITAVKFQVLSLEDEDQMDVDDNNVQDETTQYSLLISITIKPKALRLKQNSGTAVLLHGYTGSYK